MLPKSASKARAHRARGVDTSGVIEEGAPLAASGAHDKALRNIFGSTNWSTLPLWRKAVERAKLKARLAINVVRAFEENAKVRVCV